MQATLEWTGNGKAFEATPPSGFKIVFDTDPDFGGTGAGPMPLETMVCAIAACTALDVLSILEKKRQKVTAYRIEVDWDRDPPGDWPRPIKAIRIRHVVEGENIEEAALARAIELSDQKYCSATATLRFGPTIANEWQII